MAAKKASSKATRNSGKKKTAMKAVAKKTPTIKEPLTKSGLLKAIMEMTGLGKKDVTAVFEGLETIIELSIRSRGPGKFVMPGLYKIVAVKKPARPARKGINPFTKEVVTFKAKPAQRVVKIKALKKLKELAA